MTSEGFPPGGRRQRTLLITDIVRSTEHLARLGDARWSELMERHSEIVRERVDAAHGWVVNDRGDGFLISFDLPARAVACAEELCASMAEHGLELRAGLHAGEVELLGKQLAGMAIHITARISELAGPGEVLVSSAVYELLAESGLDFRDCGIRPLRGVPGQWGVYSLRSERLAGARLGDRADVEEEIRVPLPPLAAARLAETALVDRATERARLLAALERVREGGQRTVLIGGEPGIGKTRLTAEIAAQAYDIGATILWGRCDPELGVPYQPFVEVLTHYARFAPQELLAQHRAQYGRELARLVPELSGSEVPAVPSVDRSRAENRHLMFAAVAALLRSASLRQPLVLVFDDLHWADKPTLLMLKYLLLSAEPTRALVIGTYRSPELPRAHPLTELVTELRREPGFEHIELAGLGSEDVVEMAQQVVQEPLDAASVDLVQVLGAETDGNPFFLAEIVRNLAGAGGLARAAQHSAAGMLPTASLPRSIRDTIVARVARMGPRTEQVLSTAAVVGREFELELLARMLDEPEEQLVEVLDAAVEAALIAEMPGIGLRHTFVHPLIPPALCDQLGGGRRRLLHRRALEALEQLLGEESQRQRIGELAQHALAGVPIVETSKAIAYVRRAGEHALAQLAPQEAMRWFEHALTLHRRAAGDAAQDLGDPLLCDLLIGRGIAQQQSGDPEFRTTLLQASRVALGLGDRDRLVRAVLANTRGFASETGRVDAERVAMVEHALEAVGDSDSAARAQLLAILSAELTFAGDWERRKALSDESTVIAARLGDPTVLSDVLSVRFITIWTPETLEQRLADTKRELAIAEEIADPLALFRALHWRAAAAVEAGDLELAAALVARESEVAERLGQPTYSWLAAYDRATQALMHGLLEEAERSAEDAGQIALASQQPEALAFHAGQLLNIRFEQGRLGELEPLIAQQAQANPGIPAFRAALVLARSESGMREEALEVLEVDAASGFRQIPYDSNWLAGLVIYGQAVATLAAPAAAGELHRLLAPWAGQVAFNSATTWGLVQRILGSLDRVLGRYDAAQERLEDAAARHEQMGAPIWLARTRLDLARVLRAKGEASGRSEELLEQALGTAQDLGCLAIERQATELLGRVGEPA